MSVNSPSPSFIYEVFEHQKPELLLHLLDSLPDFNRVMVFLRTRDGVHTLTSDLARAGVSVDSIHGQKKPELRDRAMRAFNEGKIRVLIATDAVARGMDISGAHHVVNVEIPELHDDYQHRMECVQSSGGQVITFVSPQDIPLLAKLECFTSGEIPRKRAEGFVYATQPINVKPPRKKGGTSKGLRSKPLQNKKPKFKNKRGRK